MLIQLYSQATTTPKIRAKIQASDEPARILQIRILDEMDILVRLVPLVAFGLWYLLRELHIYTDIMVPISLSCVVLFWMFMRSGKGE